MWPRGFTKGSNLCSYSARPRLEHGLYNGATPLVVTHNYRCFGSVRLSTCKSPQSLIRGGGDEPEFGTGRGIRTPDILLPKQVLYQTELYP